MDTRGGGASTIKDGFKGLTNGPPTSERSPDTEHADYCTLKLPCEVQSSDQVQSATLQHQETIELWLSGLLKMRLLKDDLLSFLKD